MTKNKISQSALTGYDPTKWNELESLVTDPTAPDRGTLVSEVDMFYDAAGNWVAKFEEHPIQSFFLGTFTGNILSRWIDVSMLSIAMTTIPGMDIFSSGIDFGEKSLEAIHEIGENGLDFSSFSSSPKPLLLQMPNVSNFAVPDQTLTNTLPANN